MTSAPKFIASIAALIASLALMWSAYTFSKIVKDGQLVITQDVTYHDDDIKPFQIRR